MIAKELKFDGQTLRIEERELPEPTESQAVVKAEYSGISAGTERALIQRARTRGEPAPPLGYSLVGTVVAVGPDSAAGVGQRVLAEAPHASATLVDASFGSLIPIPPELDPVHAAFGTLVAVALHAVQRANVRLGESALVFGFGVVGALIAQLLRRGGAGWVGVVEPDDKRRALATALGADVAVASCETDLFGSPDPQLGEGVDVVVEAAASPGVFPSALRRLRIGGRLVCTSTFFDGLDVRLYPDVVEKELTIVGAHQPKCPSFRVPYYPHCRLNNRRWGLELVAGGSLKVAELITHRVPWEDAPAFYARMESDRSILAAVIDWTE